MKPSRPDLYPADLGEPHRRRGARSLAISWSMNRPSIPAPPKRFASRCWSKFGPDLQQGLLRRLQPRAHQSRRQGHIACPTSSRSPPARPPRWPTVWTTVYDKRYDGGHPQSELDQGRGSRQSDREHSARRQYRARQRARACSSSGWASTRARCWRPRAPNGTSCPSGRAWSAATASASIPTT